jgi:hypothetical protein
MKAIRTTWLVLLGILVVGSVSAQRVLLVEKANSPKTMKLYEGTYIQYRLVDDKDWYKGQIVELREDVQMIAFDDRLVPLADVATLRQGRAWVRGIGTMLTTFGVAWSLFAAVGTATDGNPDTSYAWSDAVVTGAFAGTGLVLPLLLGDKRMHVGEGKKRRLRIIDIRF